LPGAALTQTVPEPGSTVQISSDLGPTPSNAATASGIVVRTEDDPSTARETLDVKVLATDPPITLMGGRLKDFALDVDLSIRQRLIRPSGHIALRIGQNMGRNEIELKTLRAQRGLQLLESGDGAVVRISPHLYRVRRPSGRGFYEVKCDGWRWVCECSDFQNDSQLCVHAWAVELAVRIHAEIERPERKPVIIDLAKPGPECSNCGGTAMRKRGFRRCRKGAVQRYQCKRCKRRVTLDNGFNRIHSEPRFVVAAFDLWALGLSYRNIAHHLRDIHGVTVGKSTVERWVRRMAGRITFLADTCGPQVGGIWHADETNVNVDGKLRYVWNVMDHDTRYWLASTLSVEKRVSDARKPLRHAKTVAGGRPQSLVTDGNPSYKDAVRKELYSSSDFTLHLVIPPIRRTIGGRLLELHPGNNIMERLQGFQRDRTKVMRGFNDLTSAGLLTSGLRGYYNFVRPHLGLGGMTPAERAGVSIPGLESDGRLMAILVAAYRAQRRAE
jgi:transposase-like protein